LERHHGLSFSAACGNPLRQAACRIFGSEKVTVAGLLAGHREQTRARAWTAPGERVLVAQDTTILDYSTHPATTDLGPFDGHAHTRGLLAHSALALTETGLPLGIVSLHVWARDPAEFGKKHTRQQRDTKDKESQKWLTGLAESEAAFTPEQPLLVVADREADLYDYFTAPRRQTTDLLVRAAHPRRVDILENGAPPPDQGGLLAAVAAAPPQGTYTVRVPARPGQPAREAVVTLRCTRVRLLVPQDYRRRRASADPAGPRPQPAPEPEVQVVEAREEQPPAGATPLHWVLITTLPVPDAAAARQVVAYYERRWGIERLHLTLKSGLQVERLQIDDATSLSHALAVYYLVAWRLLWLTHWARVDPDGSPEGLVSPLERQVLTAAAGQPLATRRAVVRAIAKLGGFAGNPKAGEPGVKSLWLGLRQLEAMVQGWLLAQQAGGVMKQA
jgi:hypothetical protein